MACVTTRYKEAMGKRVCVLRMAFLPYLIPPERQFIEGLQARGFDITLVKSYVRRGKEKEESRPGLCNRMIDLLTKRWPKSKWIEPLVFVEFILRSTLLGVWSRPDLVVAIDVDTLLQGWIVSRLCRAKLIYYSIELYSERPGFSPKRFWVWFERRLINKAHLAVACEPNRARVMQEKYGARELPMTVLNVPPYSQPEHTTVIPDYLRARGLEGKRVAYYMGEIKAARCIDQFIEAARRFDDSIVLFLIGPVEPGYDVHAKIRECGVERKVFVHPPVHPREVMAFACSADLGLQTQLNDGLNHLYCAPIKLFQYLMAGLPVLASNFPGMVDVVEKNEAGLCVDPEDVEAIAAAINTILGDAALWRRMSENALRVAKDRYCYEIESRRLFEAVDRLMD